MTTKAEIEMTESGYWYVYIDGIPRTPPLKARRMAIAYCKQHGLEYELID